MSLKSWKRKQNETELTVYQIPLLETNFGYLIEAQDTAIIVDPGEADPFFSLLEEKSLHLEAILITHHHQDHIGGAQELAKETKADILGPAHEKLLFADQQVDEGEEYTIAKMTFEVFKTPGHTLDHVVYFFPEANFLFSGDHLFLYSTGKMFEGSSKQFFESLQKIKSLPQETLVFCGHNYIKNNAPFAKKCGKKNAQVDPEDTSTVHTLAQELEGNPFMQVKTPEAFHDLRKKKDKMS